MFEIYKKNQGKHTRVGTFVGGMILGVIGGHWLSERLESFSPWVQYLVPFGVVMVIAYVMFVFVNRAKMADFLIATEGEMKKVAWSSRKEVIGSTKVVVFATFLLAALLFIVDTLFQGFFKWIGVLHQLG